MKCLHLLFLCCCYSYSAALSTDPVSVNGETPVVSAVEDASNVTVFCAVNQTGTMMPSFTTWRITRAGGSSLVLGFDNDGNPDNSNSLNFRVTGTPFFSGTRQSNLTIVIFDSSLDNALLECLEGTTFKANFSLKLISKYSLYNF